MLIQHESNYDYLLLYFNSNILGNGCIDNQKESGAPIFFFDSELNRR